jgi:hypothetical protein
MKYYMGNLLRGYHYGDFKAYDDEKAWIYLSNMFLLSFPCETGRLVSMYREEKMFGFTQILKVRAGLTSLEKIDNKKVIRKCKNHLPYLI